MDQKLKLQRLLKTHKWRNFNFCPIFRKNYKAEMKFVSFCRLFEEKYSKKGAILISALFLRKTRDEIKMAPFIQIFLWNKLKQKLKWRGFCIYFFFCKSWAKIKIARFLIYFFIKMDQKLKWHRLQKRKNGANLILALVLRKK